MQSSVLSDPEEFYQRGKVGFVIPSSEDDRSVVCPDFSNRVRQF